MAINLMHLGGFPMNTAWRARGISARILDKDKPSTSHRPVSAFCEHACARISNCRKRDRRLSQYRCKDILLVQNARTLLIDLVHSNRGSREPTQYAAPHFVGNSGGKNHRRIKTGMSDVDHGLPKVKSALNVSNS